MGRCSPLHFLFGRLNDNCRRVKFTPITAVKPVTPLLAADIVIHERGQSWRSIVLIKRINPPYGWALPGGFVDVGETVEAAAVREAREETALDVTLEGLLGIYSRPDRDPRGHTVSAVFVATGSGRLRAADDAQAAAVFSIDQLPQPMAFDHMDIVQDYARYLDRHVPGVV